MKALYTVFEGRELGPAAVRVDRAPRARVGAYPARRGARPLRGVIRRVLKWSLLVGLLVFVALLVYMCVVFVQVVLAAHRDDARPSDAIIVLGAAQFDGRPSKILAARLDHAVELYRRGIAPTIVVTGGNEPGDRFTEAGTAAAYLHAHGVPESAILRETTSRTSWQSLSAAARFLKARDMSHVVLVSDPYHSARIEDIAHDVGLHAVTSPTRTSPIKGWGEWRRYLTETVRVAAGRVFGYGRLDRHRQVERLVPGLATMCPPLRRRRRCRWNHPFGGGVIGNTTGSGPVIGGSSPPPRAQTACPVRLAA